MEQIDCIMFGLLSVLATFLKIGLFIPIFWSPCRLRTTYVYNRRSTVWSSL